MPQIPRVYSDLNTALDNIKAYSEENKCIVYLCCTPFNAHRDKEYFFKTINEIAEWETTSEFTLYKQEYVRKKKFINEEDIKVPKDINVGELLRVNI